MGKFTKKEHIKDLIEEYKQDKGWKAEIFSYDESFDASSLGLVPRQTDRVTKRLRGRHMRGGLQWVKRQMKMNSSTKKSVKKQIKNVDCKVDKAGVDYKGAVSKTESGRVCQPWNKRHPKYQIRQFVAGDRKHNHCRNPNDDKNGPWCYLSDYKQRKDGYKNWEYCKIPKC